MSLCVPKKILEQHSVILGKTGSGKSSVMRHFVEDLLERQQRVCIVDPKGDWYGLKLSADGKGPGFPVIGFGDFKDARASDVPINEHSGKEIAKLITSGNRPCVIGLRGWMPGAQARFWIDFASTVFNSNSCGGLHIFIDEIQNFAPKDRAGFGDENMQLHWTKKLLSEGRGLGLSIFSGSQRPQSVHNGVLTQSETLFAMRVIHKRDRDAIKDWIEGCGDPSRGKEVLDSLAGLERGEAYVWSPEIGFGPVRVKFPMFKTFDSFAPPQLQKKVGEKGWADVDLAAVKEKLAKVIEEAQASDPKALQRKVAELTRQLNAKPAPAPAAKAETKTIEKPVLKDGQLARAEKIINDFSSIEARIGNWAKASAEIVKPIADALILIRQPAPRVTPARPIQQPRPAVIHRPQPPKANGDHVEGDLSGPEQRILDAIAWLESVGVPEPEQTAVAFLAGYAFGGGGFNNPRGALNTRGMVAYRPSNRIALTDEGRAVAKFPDEVLTTDELHRKVLGILPTPEQRILKPLLEAYPNVVSNEDLSAAAGYTNGSGGYNNPRGRLRTLGLVEYRDGGVAARSILFLD